jgi:hypothetical protein
VELRRGDRDAIVVTRQEAFMDTTRLDRWTRRMFGLAVGGATASLFGLSDTAAKQRDNGERSGGRDRQIERAKAEKKKKLKQGPAGPAGPPGPTGPIPTVAVTRYVEGAPSAPLAVEVDSFASSNADCAGLGAVVNCGYLLSGTGAELANVVVRRVEVNDGENELSNCIATMVRTSEAGSTAGAQIQAVATCLE